MKSPVAVRVWMPLVLGSALTPAARSQPAIAVAPAAARFELSHDDVLIDEPIPIVVSALTPGATVTVRLHGASDDVWTSNATFIADRDGRIDLTRMAPTRRLSSDSIRSCRHQGTARSD
jgi:hypothetical protein